MNILTYLVDNKLLTDNLIPFETGTKRYLISKEPKHQGGNNFAVPISYQGYFMETHKSREGAAIDILRFLNKIDGLKIKHSNNQTNEII